jgi:antibiotic biosynthesis monooxygenase (ABM) superfamily enzyme
MTNLNATSVDDPVLLPMVVALGYVFRPFRLPVLLEQALSTIIPVVLLTWVVMPTLTRLLYRWLYSETAA